MNRLSELIVELCPDGVEYVELGKIADIGTGRSDRKDAVESGPYPFYVRSQEVLKKNDYEFDEEAILVPGEGGIGQVFHYVNGKYALHQRVYRIHLMTDSVLTMFAKRYMESEFLWFITREAVTATVKSIRKPMIQKFRIPVPPIEVQREIVRILDSFQELDDALTAEIEAREKQWQCALQESLHTIASNSSVPFGSVVEIKNGDRGKNYPAKSTLHSSGLPFVSGIDIVNRAVSTDKLLYLNDEQYSRLRAGKITKGDILFCIRGSIGKWGVFQFERGAIASSMVVLRPKEQINKSYLRVILDSDYMSNQIYKSRAIGGASSMSASDLSRFVFPVPSPSTQIQIAYRLDAMQALIDSLRSERDARRKQFEYYRDKLLSFPEKVS